MILAKKFRPDSNNSFAKVFCFESQIIKLRKAYHNKISMKKAFFSSESNFKHLSFCKKIKNGNGSCSFFSQTMYNARFKFKNKECGSTSRRKLFNIFPFNEHNCKSFSTCYSPKFFVSNLNLAWYTVWEKNEQLPWPFLIFFAEWQMFEIRFWRKECVFHWYFVMISCLKLNYYAFKA